MNGAYPRTRRYVLRYGLVLVALFSVGVIAATLMVWLYGALEPRELFSHRHVIEALYLVFAAALGVGLNLGYWAMLRAREHPTP